MNSIMINRNKYEIRLLFRTTTRIPLRSRSTLRFAAFTTSPHPRSITSRKHTQIHAHLANMSQDSTVCKNIPRNRPTRKFIPKIPNISLELPMITANPKTLPKIASPILYIPRIQTFRGTRTLFDSAAWDPDARGHAKVSDVCI